MHAIMCMENPLRSFTPEYIRAFYEMENEVSIKKEAEKIITMIKDACKLGSTMPAYITIPCPHLRNTNVEMLLKNGFEVYQLDYSQIWQSFFIVWVPNFDIVSDIKSKYRKCKIIKLELDDKGVVGRNVVHDTL